MMPRDCIFGFYDIGIHFKDGSPEGIAVFEPDTSFRLILREEGRCQKHNEDNGQDDSTILLGEFHRRFLSVV